jgi:hypothetical protein
MGSGQRRSDQLGTADRRDHVLAGLWLVGASPLQMPQ